MPRIVRNYQHQDFSYLLEPREMPTPPAPQQKAKPPVVSSDKRRRDSLMANRNLRYILSSNGVFHDRDCSHAAQIPDHEFDMCADFPGNKTACLACYRKAMVRAGLDLNLTKYMDMVMRIFNRANAGNGALHILFRVHNAQIYRVEADCVYLRVKDDCWMLQPENKECLLYHNNYQIINETQRLLEDDFHLQIYGSIPFSEAVQIMCRYCWDEHLQTILAKQRKRRRAILRQKLSVVPNYRFIPKFPLFHRWFYIADADNYLTQKKHPIRIRKTEYSKDSCSLLLCSVPRWKVSILPELSEEIKAYCVKQERDEYVDFCLHCFPAVKEV